MTDQQPEVLRQSELSNKEWLKKTEWVQQSAQPQELGMHRADVIKQRIDRLLAENEQLRLYASGADMLVGVWKARAQEFMNSSNRLRAEMEAIGAGGVGGVGPLIVPSVQHQHESSNDNDLQPETAHLSTSTSSSTTFDGVVDDGDISNFHRAMLAAAPQPQVVEQPEVEQEPVAWLTKSGEPRNWGSVECSDTPLYTHPNPKPLTDEQIMVACDAIGSTRLLVKIARAIERAHGIGQEGSAA